MNKTPNTSLILKCSVPSVHNGRHFYCKVLTVLQGGDYFIVRTKKKEVLWVAKSEVVSFMYVSKHTGAVVPVDKIPPHAPFAQRQPALVH